jgi:transposase
MNLAAADRDTLLATIAAQERELTGLRAQVASLTAQIAELTARLGQNSTNSSRPPSSDLPGRRPPKPPSPPGGRRPGGQPGHPGHFRLLRPADTVDQIVVCLPERCQGCDAALATLPGADDPADERRQVVELPVVAATVTEYQLAARRCAACGMVTRATVPAGGGTEGFGPQLTAVVALLTGRYRLSKREAAQCLADLFEVELCVGSVSALEQTMSAALGPVVAEAQAAAQTAPVANMDETGWREGRTRAWVWTVVTAALTVFHIDPRRGGQVARRLLGADWSGVVGTDRGTMYSWLPAERRQVCWAHLKRDFQKLVDWGPGARPIGQRLLTIEAQVFAGWHRFRAGEIDRPALLGILAPRQAEMAQVLEEAIAGTDAKAAGVCWELRKLWPALWTFAVVAGVEPTNNAAERALRPAVLWRKGSFGTHSAAGSRFVERMLTVTASCRQQSRPVLEVLRAALGATQSGTTPPSLLPTTG